MKKSPVTILCLFTFTLGLTAPVLADAADGKEVVATLVRTTVDRVLAVLTDKKLSREDKRNEVMKAIEPVVDFRLMAKLTLGRKHWPKLGVEQRESFTKLLVDTLKASYFKKIDLFSEGVVEFEEPVAKKTKFHVLTYIVSKGERVEVAYKLYQRAGAWKIYDFEIEGVSIVRSYGSQYDDFLREGSVEELLAKIRGKIKAARKKERRPDTPPEKKTEKKKKKEKRAA